MSRMLKMMCMTDEVVHISENAHPLTITAGSNRYLNDYQLYGNSVQDGDPTPDAPIEVQSVGDLVTKGDYAGKYKIPVTITSGDTVKTTDIYLDEPLRKLGGHADYVDFKNKKVVRKCVKKHLNDYDGWSLTSESEVNYGFTLNDSSVLPRNGKADKEDYYGYSNVFKLVGTKSFTNLVDTITMNDMGRNVRVYIDKTRLTAGTVTAFRQWLKENDPYHIRVRNIALEQPIELPKVLQFKGENTYTVQTDLTPSGLQVKYY